jgi:hypothetical protein
MVKATFKVLMIVALIFVMGISILLFFFIPVEGDSGWKIDLFCQHGGLGENVTSSPFIVGSRIILFAYVTYNQKPMQSVLVAFQVDNPQGSPLLTTTERTNASGIATTNFTITRNNYPSFPSLWEAIATASPAQTTIIDTMPFLIFSPIVGGISSSIPASFAFTLATATLIEILIASALLVFARFRRHYSRAP